MAERKDPFRGFNFLVEIKGVARGAFRECSGLDTTQDIVEYREGDEAVISPRKLPGLAKYANIVLKGGVTDDKSLWEWRKKAIDGKVERKDGSIVLLNEAREEKKRWNFFEAWPAKWTGPSFNATSNDVAIETLEIAHERLELA